MRRLFFVLFLTFFSLSMPSALVRARVPHKATSRHARLQGVNPITQQAYLKSSNVGSFNYFGEAVAVDGNTAVVGVSRESDGVAYVYTRNGTVWTQQAVLESEASRGIDSFGVAVAIDGDTIVVGASTDSRGGELGPFIENAGAAYVFVRDGDSWNEQAFLTSFNAGAYDVFGHSVAISGNTIVIGAPGENGGSVGVNGADNDDATDAGAAYIFTRSDENWSQQAYLKPFNTDTEDEFGTSVAISNDTVIVGALREDGSTTIINGPDDNDAVLAGAAYVFTRSGDDWSQEAYLKPFNTGAYDQFGTSVAVSGDTVIIGAPDEDGGTNIINGPDDNSAGYAGAAYIFTRSGGTWSQQAYLKPFNTDILDTFGTSVALDGDRSIVGSPSEDGGAMGVNGPNNNDVSGSGAAYVFTRSGNLWSQQAYLKPFNTGEFDLFGTAVALSDSTIIVGATLEDGGATGVNGPDNDNVSAAGAAYVFGPIAYTDLDVNDDGYVTPADVVYVLKRLNDPVTVENEAADVDNDNDIDADDAQIVMDALGITLP